MGAAAVFTQFHSVQFLDGRQMATAGDCEANDRMKAVVTLVAYPVTNPLSLIHTMHSFVDGKWKFFIST